ncbi:protein kinase [Reticulomyxa filosa]|uniref:Protein kinase n=1 Tax=Reticulomyxa filosa TaxID=46433 RepID=X6MMM9_RETFI|nr:protein kinase [Reticulomyxa filosa]|eukprot:ETO15273.1 protein kinase [Reticulomyxa filosa]
MFSLMEKGKDLKDNIIYAVKQINKARFYHIGKDSRKDILQNMKKEINIQKQLNHPNIVQLYEVYKDQTSKTHANLNKLLLVYLYYIWTPFFRKKKSPMKQEERHSVPIHVFPSLNNLNELHIFRQLLSMQCLKKVPSDLKSLHNFLKNAKDHQISEIEENLEMK